jgi:hypothetical protein
MNALRSAKQTELEAPLSYATDPDESGIRQIPTEDDLPDLTDDAVALAAPRKAVPPPIPEAALWRKPARAEDTDEDADEEYDEKAISMLDFDLVAKSCPPKLAGYAHQNDAYPSVPGIPAYFYVSTPPDAPKQPFDYELAFHIAIVWMGALVGGLLALI